MWEMGSKNPVKVIQGIFLEHFPCHTYARFLCYVHGQQFF